MAENTSKLKISIRSDEAGHTVEWVYKGITGSAGPYLDREMAERVLKAKTGELRENTIII